MLNSQNSAAPPPSLIRRKPPKINNVGYSRRATNFLPSPEESKPSTTKQSGGAEIRRYFLRLEAEEANCCIKIESNKFRSRSALLISRGKVLECVYGKFGLSQHLIGRQAFQFILDEISDQETTLRTYYCEEQLIVAGAALIHGNQISSTSEPDFTATVNNIVSNKGAACLALLAPRTDGAICIVYLCPAGLLELSSFTASIDETDIVSFFEYLQQNQEVNMLGSFLERDKIDRLINSKYSLTGLDPNRLKDNVQKSNAEHFSEPYSSYSQAYKAFAAENFQRKFVRSTKESSFKGFIQQHDSLSQFQINPTSRMS